MEKKKEELASEKVNKILWFSYKSATTKRRGRKGRRSGKIEGAHIGGKRRERKQQHIIFFIITHITASSNQIQHMTHQTSHTLKCHSSLPLTSRINRVIQIQSPRKLTSVYWGERNTIPAPPPQIL